MLILYAKAALLTDSCTPVIVSATVPQVSFPEVTTGQTVFRSLLQTVLQIRTEISRREVGRLFPGQHCKDKRSGRWSSGNVARPCAVSDTGRKRRPNALQRLTEPVNSRHRMLNRKGGHRTPVGLCSQSSVSDRVEGRWQSLQKHSYAALWPPSAVFSTSRSDAS